MITPTIGRKVWYWPASNENVVRNGDQPMDATIVYVWHDRKVNVIVFDHAGNQLTRPNTMMLQGDEMYKPIGSYCVWMPYQIGQARAQTPPVAGPG